MENSVVGQKRVHDSLSTDANGPSGSESQQSAEYPEWCYASDAADDSSEDDTAESEYDASKSAGANSLHPWVEEGRRLIPRAAQLPKWRLTCSLQILYHGLRLCCADCCAGHV